MLRDKYQSLIAMAEGSGVTDLEIQEQDNVLHIHGTAPSEAVKQQLWDEYNRLDPDMRSGDVVLSLEVAAGSEVFYTVQSGDSLSKIATKYKGVTWQKIFEANRDQINNPDLIHPGQKLRIPTA
ncbi:MAG TPA: LysM peptidoglycan-binding domain-containing protein [Pyrinomonadaceae bacterium]|jgi:nucleoid-associated protein YgaU